MTLSLLVVIPLVTPTMPIVSALASTYSIAPLTFAASVPTVLASVRVNVPVPSSSSLSAEMIELASSATPPVPALSVTIRSVAVMSSPAPVPIVMPPDVVVTVTLPVPDWVICRSVIASASAMAMSPLVVLTALSDAIVVSRELPEPMPVMALIVTMAPAELAMMSRSVSPPSTMAPSRVVRVTALPVAFVV